jgi:hypothetical protein
MGVNTSTIVTVDLIDKITVNVGPILATMIGIDVIIATITAAMTYATTTVAIAAPIGVTGVIVMMIAMMIVTTTDEMTGVMIDIARTTTMAWTTTERSRRHRHHPKGATPMVHSRRLTTRSTSSSEVAK